MQGFKSQQAETGYSNPVVSAPSSPVASEISQLTMDIQYLGDSCATLISQLQPVAAPLPPSTGEGKSGPTTGGPVCDLELTIARLAEHVRLIAANVNSARDSIRI